MKEDFLSEIKEEEEEVKELFNSRKQTMFSPEVSQEFESEYNKKRMKYIKSDPYKANFFSRLLFFHGFDIIRYLREGLETPNNLGNLK